MGADKLISMKTAKEWLTRLPADLDAESVQRCIEELDCVPEVDRRNRDFLLRSILKCQEEQLTLLDQTKCNLFDLLEKMEAEKKVTYTAIFDEIEGLLRNSVRAMLEMKKKGSLDKLKEARKSQNADIYSSTIEHFLLSKITADDVLLEKKDDKYVITFKAGVPTAIFHSYLADEMKCIGTAFGFPVAFEDERL